MFTKLADTPKTFKKVAGKNKWHYSCYLDIFQKNAFNLYLIVSFFHDNKTIIEQWLSNTAGPDCWNYSGWILGTFWALPRPKAIPNKQYCLVDNWCPICQFLAHHCAKTTNNELQPKKEKKLYFLYLHNVWKSLKMSHLRVVL